jgi:molybdopterin-guanine dinucleotide biosynthesis protein A
VTSGGIVLCGGKSTRMGVAKATLPFGPETMLQRVVRLLGTTVSPIAAVAARDQVLPALPHDVIVARDEREAKGPLEGLRAGLAALPRRWRRPTPPVATCRCSCPASSSGCSSCSATTTLP